MKGEGGGGQLTWSLLFDDLDYIVVVHDVREADSLGTEFHTGSLKNKIKNTKFKGPFEVKKCQVGVFSDIVSACFSLETNDVS